MPARDPRTWTAPATTGSFRVAAAHVVAASALDRLAGAAGDPDTQ